jgi:hypothetical protein
MLSLDLVRYCVEHTPALHFGDWIAGQPHAPP